MEGPQIIANEDLGAEPEQGDKDDKLWVINNVTVADVLYFDTYKSCLQCKARVEPQTQCLGKCSKMDCMVMQRFDRFPQHTTVKLSEVKQAVNIAEIKNRHHLSVSCSCLRKSGTEGPVHTCARSRDICCWPFVLHFL